MPLESAKTIALARMFFYLVLAVLLEFSLAMIIVSQVSAAPPPDNPLMPPQEDPFATKVISRSILPLTYARVVTGGVPIYSHPSHVAQGIGPARSLAKGYVWVSLADVEQYIYDSRLWYMVNEGEYIEANQVAFFEPSTFRGVNVSRPLRRPFGWIIYDTWASPTPDSIPPADALALPRYSFVTIFEERQSGEWTWYRIGPNRWIEQRTAALVKPSARPGGVEETDKWIEVDLFEQTLAAYEGDQMVYATLISSGLPRWQTEQGLFRIWTKVKQAKMSGSDGYPDYYFLEDVLWTMYFNRDFSLHGTYWHDRFGYPHSHGCVNLPPQDAAWLFNWTTPTTGPNNWTFASDEDAGTWVWVHE
jgi:hypothetical protein